MRMRMRLCMCMCMSMCRVRVHVHVHVCHDNANVVRIAHTCSGLRDGALDPTCNPTACNPICTLCTSQARGATRVA